MKGRRLTRPAHLATNLPMPGACHTRASAGLRVGMLAFAAMLAGCVNVTAPDKPIVIELNVNVRQEVVYRLAADAAQTIEENRDIF
jgi:hypothetical protein